MSVLKKNIKLHPFTAPTADTGTAGTGTKEGGEQLKRAPDDVYSLACSMNILARSITKTGEPNLIEAAHLKDILNPDTCSDDIEIFRAPAEQLLGLFNAYCILDSAHAEEYFQGYDDGEFYTAKEAVSVAIQGMNNLADKFAALYPASEAFFRCLFNTIQDESEAD